MKLKELRQAYHQRICKDIIRVKLDPKKRVDYPNFADCSSASSINIALGITKQLNYVINRLAIPEQTAGGLFEKATRDFLACSFQLLQHIRPGKWEYATQTTISEFSQYEHLDDLEKAIKNNKALSTTLGGDYIIKPDIVISRYPVEDKEINQKGKIVDAHDSTAALTPLRSKNSPGQRPILHASISCKWTIRSDRSQNSRTEALNLIRNRKGHLPHIVVVTAEPLPTRIAAIALGTGDIDCVYHFALPELKAAIKELNKDDLLDLLNLMIEGKRLRDISDLPFDLAV